MSLIDHYRGMALNNAWSNRRLLEVCLKLSEEDFAARRTSFFPSLQATLNHILVVDRFYLDALEDRNRGRAAREIEVPFPKAATLASAQTETDHRLLVFCDGLTEPQLQRTVCLDRGPRGLLPDTVERVLAHLFIHQIHHRGQAHAMLAGTPIAPPQLDEFFLTEDRTAAMDALKAAGFA